MDLKNLISQLTDEHDKNAFKSKCEVISKGIQEGLFSILDLIESLGCLLTNSNTSQRKLGTSVLTEVLKTISLSTLNQQQLVVLAEFYNSKLKDHHEILPSALQGILILIQFEYFPGNSIPLLLNTIFQNVPCQQQQQSERYTIYQIFDVSLKLFKAELLNMKMEFVYHVVQSINGERDPRNLLFLFKWMQLFLPQFQLLHLTEDMFDSLACYFPVEFRASTNETSITREHLADALNPCLYAIPDFGEYCIPLALEKLESSLQIAKTDSLKLLRGGCSTFETLIYLNSASEVWSLIQKEILSTTSDEIRLDCLITLSSVLSKISEDENGVFLDIIQNILDTLKGNLLPDSKLFDRSAQILVYTASASEKSCKYIIKEVIPILTNIYNMTAYKDQKSVIFKTAIEFAKVHLKFNKCLINDEVPELSKIPVLCMELLNSENELRKVGFDCASVLVNYLSAEIRKTLYSNFKKSVYKSTDGDTRNSFLQCLKIFSSCYPEEVKTYVFKDINLEVNLMDSLLSVLAVLVNLKEFREYVIQNYVQALGNKETCEIAVCNLKQMVQQEQKNTNLLTELIHKNLVDYLIELVFKTNFNNVIVLQDISVILRLIIAPQKLESQKNILDKHYELVFRKTNECDFCILILDGLVTGLRRDVDLDIKLLDLCYKESFSLNETVKNVALILLANQLNKRNNDEQLVEYLDKTNEKCLAAVSFDTKNVLTTSSWITKSLLMRNHIHGMRWLEWLLQLLELYPEASECLKIIMDDIDESLSVDMHCQKSLLYKQKVFVSVINKIYEKYEQHESTYLRALGVILQYTPLQAVLLQFPKICKFIILCLEKNKEIEVILTVLSVIQTICKTDSALLETHLDDCISRILKLASFESSMKVRIEALRCLITFTATYPVYKLLPLKNNVIEKLSICVDDKKRLVRKEAMEARSLWLMLDAPV